MSAFGAKYILPSRVTQDALESFFSSIRGIGTFYSNPTPAEFDNRVRILNFLRPRAKGLAQNQLVMLDATVDTQTATKLRRMARKRKYACTRCDGKDMGLPVEEGCVYMTDDGMANVAGVVAHKLRVCYPDLGTESRLLANPPAWLDYTSHGGLRNPSDSWFAAVRQLEKAFISHHGQNGLHTYAGGVALTVRQLLHVGYNTAPVRATRCFARTRCFIRMREINKTIRAGLRRRRDRKRVKKHMS